MYTHYAHTTILRNTSAKFVYSVSSSNLTRTLVTRLELPAKFSAVPATMFSIKY